MSPHEILLPNGMPIGQPGGRRRDKQDIRELAGGKLAAEALFARLAVGGVPNVPINYPGIGVDLAGGGWIGLRPVSKSGPPTIDIDVPEVPIKKLKFL